MVRRVLSSRSNWTYKYFWPGFSAALVVAGTIALCCMSPAHDRGIIWVGRIALPLIGAGTVAYGIYFGRTLKHVEMDDDAIYVSYHQQEIRVPFSEIDTCQVNMHGGGTKRPLVTITLRHSTAFGREVKFLAPLPWNIGHSIVADLRERRDRAIRVGPNPAQQ